MSSTVACAASPAESDIPRYQKIHDRSYSLLDGARRSEAALKKKYNSQETRRQMQAGFREKSGKPDWTAREWQLDIAESVLLGLDTILVAGTGSGKTIPFMLALMGNKMTMAVISPLKVLQHEHADCFNVLGLNAVVVNSDTWRNPELRKRILENQVRVIFAGPEMWLQHTEFRKAFRDSGFCKNLCALVIDEAHCISLWGGQFRKEYANLDKLRASFPAKTPILAATATLNVTALRDLRTTLNLDPDSCFHINLGNVRTNIATEVHLLKSGQDFDTLLKYLTINEDILTMPKTLIFTNTVILAQSMCEKFRNILPNNIRHLSDYFHAHRGPIAKRRTETAFRQGRIRILWATEAFGMGADIPDIVNVIHFGIPSSLSVLLQRIGRAGRDPSIQARAILLVEASMFQQQKKRRARKTKGVGEADSESGDDSLASSSSESDEEVVAEDDGGGSCLDADASSGESVVIGVKGGGLDEERQWRKAVDPIVREWIETDGCPNEVIQKHFSNPPHREPLGECCDRPNCAHRTPGSPLSWDAEIGTLVRSLSNLRPPAKRSKRPSTPDPVTAQSSTPPMSPSKSLNTNGKRAMPPPSESLSTTDTSGPKYRRGDHLKSVKALLREWRYQKVCSEPYVSQNITDECILPDWILKGLASDKTLTTLADLSRLNPPWMLAHIHGEEVLEKLRSHDEAFRKRHERDVQERRAAKKAQTKAVNEAKKMEKKRATEARKLQEVLEREAAFQKGMAEEARSRATAAQLAARIAFASMTNHPIPEAP